MQLQSSPSGESKSPILVGRLPVGIRRIILGALASTQLIFAQDDNKAGGHDIHDKFCLTGETSVSSGSVMDQGYIAEGLFNINALHAHAQISDTISAAAFAEFTEPFNHKTSLQVEDKFGASISCELTPTTTLTLGGIYFEEESDNPHTITETTKHDDGHGHIETKTHTHTSIAKHEDRYYGLNFKLAQEITDHVKAEIFAEIDEDQSPAGDQPRFGPEPGKGYFVRAGVSYNDAHFGPFIANFGTGLTWTQGDRSAQGTFIDLQAAVRLPIHEKFELFLRCKGIVPVANHTSQSENGFMVNAGVGFTF